MTDTPPTDQEGKLTQHRLAEAMSDLLAWVMEELQRKQEEDARDETPQGEDEEAEGEEG